MTHGDMKENVSGCFFSEHSVLYVFWRFLRFFKSKKSWLFTFFAAFRTF